MLHVKVTADKANKYKVSLSNEDKTAAKERGDTELASMTEQQKEIISISQQDIYRIMEDASLYRKVIEAVTKDYQLSEADFNAYFEQNKEQFLLDLRSRPVLFIQVDIWEGYDAKLQWLEE